MKMTDINKTFPMPRRNLLRGGLGIAGALTTGALLPHPAAAA